MVQVALSFFKSAVVNMSFKLDAIVCLVDAKHIMQHLTEVKADNAVNESVRQVAFSDKIIVNKKDLVRTLQNDVPFARAVRLVKWPYAIKDVKI